MPSGRWGEGRCESGLSKAELWDPLWVLGKGDSTCLSQLLDSSFEVYAQVPHVPLPPLAKNRVTVFPEGQATEWPISNELRSKLGVAASPHPWRWQGRL